MNNQEITVVYKWTAKQGKEDELKAIYKEVEKEMQATEPNAIKVDCYFDESTRTLQKVAGLVGAASDIATAVSDTLFQLDLVGENYRLLTDGIRNTGSRLEAGINSVELLDRGVSAVRSITGG